VASQQHLWQSCVSSRRRLPALPRTTQVAQFPSMLSGGGSVTSLTRDDRDSGYVVSTRAGDGLQDQSELVRSNHGSHRRITTHPAPTVQHAYVAYKCLQRGYYV